MSDIEPDMRFRPVEGLELNHVPDGVMVYQASRERVHFLNQTAVVVFELCGLDKTVGAIEAFMADAFGLAEPPTEVVRSCLRSLLDEGLVTPCSPSSAAP